MKIILSWLWRLVVGMSTPYAAYFRHPTAKKKGHLTPLAEYC
ncbi:hypothetical protein PMAG_a1246 [Pseudoalteromonas mariniglutinosa NCIMB 1770]|nr:hypothetical protein [Pseudoalteromonas mariniglutinosa NCIMB 1770]